jgi:nitric oxide dioxygenase
MVCNGSVTPEQIELVETTIEAIGLDELAADFYRRAFALDPSLADMFTAEPAVQEQRFAAELALIITSIRRCDDFEAETHALGARHRRYGVRAAHYRLMGEALMGALAGALDTRWNDAVEEAWRLAYNLTAETMMAGAEAAAR